MDGGDAMTVAMIVEVPGVTEEPNVTVWRMLGAPLHLGNLVPVVPPAAPLIVDAADGEPTWEDAAWQ
jgi:hypothetical protein